MGAWSPAVDLPPPFGVPWARPSQKALDLALWGEGRIPYPGPPTQAPLPLPTPLGVVQRPPHHLHGP
jgi:hypothetical protein